MPTFHQLFKISVQPLLTRALSLALLTFCPLLRAETPYQPKIVHPFLESWRWSELEALSNYDLRCVDEAEDGTLWFARNDGVMSYDGKSVQIYRFADSGLESSRPNAITVGPNGMVHVLTESYLIRFEQGEFSIVHESREGNALTDSFSRSRFNTLWVGDSKGLFQISEKDGTVKKVETLFKRISAVLVDRSDRLWVADQDGGSIAVFQLESKNPSNELLVPVLFFEGKNNSPRNETRLLEGPSGRIWISNLHSPHPLRFFENGILETAISSGMRLSPTQAMVEDIEHNLWMFSVDGHLSRLSDNGFEEYRMDEVTMSSSYQFAKLLSASRIIVGGRMAKTFTIDESLNRWTTYRQLNFHHETANGDCWFISYDGKIVRRIVSENRWVAYDENDGALPIPNSLIGDKAGNIWVSGKSSGNTAAISRFDGETWETDNFPKFSSSISHLSALELSDGAIAFGSGSGASYMGKRTGGLVTYRMTQSGWKRQILTSPNYPNRIASLAETSDGSLWIGAIGLFEKKRNRAYNHVNRFGSNWIDHVVSDASDNLWVAVWGSGVHQFDGQTWRRFGEAQGLASDQVIDILPTNQEPYLWVATSQGISRYDGASWTANALPKEIRLDREGGTLKSGRNRELWINSAFRSWNFRSSELVDTLESQFYAIRRIPETNPPETNIDPIADDLLEGANAMVQMHGNDPWSQTHSDQLEYSFRVDEGKWSPFSTKTETLLTHLKAGHRIFEARARDLDGNIDPTPASISFKVIPPLWKRPWFLLLTAATIALIVTLVVILIRMRIQHLLAIEEFRIQFFTNISHEIRTPLSVIIGPLESVLAKETDPRSRQLLEIAHRNAKKILTLVSHLLDFRRIESGKQKYRPVKGDLILFSKDALYAHSPLWEEKEQLFTVSSQQEEKEAYFDPDKLQRIIDNLLSNAIKYTPASGAIRVKIAFETWTEDESQECLKFSVEDDGPGIPKENLNSIFEPYQRAVVGQKRYTGSGIGLAYTRELVQLWGGKLEVDSPISEKHGKASGTRFTVLLPLIGDLSAPTMEQSAEPISLQAIETSMKVSKKQKNEADNQQPRLLIAEDNPDVRTFLSSELGQFYSVELTQNGKECLEKAKAQEFDLILSDVMMPEMDGIELCRHLKSTDETSHIPLIMITARNSDEHEIEGVRSGADDYLGKPVNLDLLKAKIETLIQSRRNLRERFAKKLVIEPTDVAVTDLDAQFISRSMQSVENHMRDEDFDVDAFAREMRMSRASFQRKLKALTAMTPVQFMRNLRLKRAAQLLKSGQFNVSEVIEQVGILDQSYFGKLFKREFGVSPSSLIPKKDSNPISPAEEPDRT